MHITLTRRKGVIFGLVALALAVLAAVAFLAPAASPTAANTIPPEQAAVTFTRAFYTVDYRDQAAWLATLKPLATEAGYGYIQHAFVPALWPQLTTAQTVTTPDQVQAQDAGLRRAGKNWQIRAVAVTVTPPWPSMKQADFTAFVLLEQDPTTQAWLFMAFLSESEVQDFQGK